MANAFDYISADKRQEAQMLLGPSFDRQRATAFHKQGNSLSAQCATQEALTNFAEIHSKITLASRFR